MRWRPAEPWFGPKRYGWGWRPISIEGWVVALIYMTLLLAVAAIGAIFQPPAGFIAGAVAALSVALLVVCAITSGPPGRARD